MQHDPGCSEVAAVFASPNPCEFAEASTTGGFGPSSAPTFQRQVDTINLWQETWGLPKKI